MHNEVEDEQVLRASTEVASNADQPSWVSELQASLQAGLDKIQAKMDISQHRMDAKLDKIGKQMEEMKQGMEASERKLIENSNPWTFTRGHQRKKFPEDPRRTYS
jgi:hypothetical protein